MIDGLVGFVGLALSCPLFATSTTRVSTVLSADLLYVASTAGAPAYSPLNNDHYQYLDDNNVDLKVALKPATQSGLLGLPVAATAGVMTTRAAANAFLAGKVLRPFSMPST